MTTSLTSAARRRQMLKKRNLLKAEVYVPDRMKRQLKELEPALREGSTLRIFPPLRLSHDMMTNKGLDFMTNISPWTADALFAELAHSDLLDPNTIGLKLIDSFNPSIEIDYIDLGRTAVMTLHGEQILVSLLICPVDDVTDKSAMNEQLLKAHKYLPLSTMGITSINGQDFYELFGSLSSRSLLTSVATEIMALAENYEEVVTAFNEVIVTS